MSSSRASQAAHSAPLAQVRLATKAVELSIRLEQAWAVALAAATA